MGVSNWKEECVLEGDKERSISAAVDEYSVSFLGRRWRQQKTDEGYKSRRQKRGRKKGKRERIIRVKKEMRESGFKRN